jgi:hypothetical protein
MTAQSKPEGGRRLLATEVVGVTAGQEHLPPARGLEVAGSCWRRFLSRASGGRDDNGEREADP